MKFRVTSKFKQEEVYAGQIITYKVSPVLGLPLFWMTEITHVVPQKLFVDEQRKGPYKMWHHQHHFEEQNGGTLMTDMLHYEPPFGILGTIADRLFITGQVKEIFKFRKKKIIEIFG